MKALRKKRRKRRKSSRRKSHSVYLGISERNLSYGILNNMYIINFSLWRINKYTLFFDPDNNMVSEQRNFKFCYLKMKEKIFREVVRFTKGNATRKWER